MTTASQPAWLEALRARVRTIEGGGIALGRDVARLGAPLDGDLPWQGLPRRAVHEVGGTAASSFAAALAARFLRDDRGSLIWCQTARSEQQLGALYGPGLAPYGLDWRRLVLVRAADEREVLWAVEESLRSPAVTCAVAELSRVDLVTSRRLQLAAESGRGAGILLRTGVLDPTPNAALTRWRAEPLPGADGLAWRLILWRCRGGAPGTWTVGWDERTLAFAVAPGMAAGAGPARGTARRRVVPA